MCLFFLNNKYNLYNLTRELFSFFFEIFKIIFREEFLEKFLSSLDSKNRVCLFVCFIHLLNIYIYIFFFVSYSRNSYVNGRISCTERAGNTFS